MVMVKGSHVSLDDLIGYSKLQDVLDKIIAALNAQDETIASLRNEVEGATTRLDAQDKVVQQVRFDCQDTNEKVKESFKAHAVIEQKSSELSKSFQSSVPALQKKMSEVEAQIKKAANTDDIKAQLKALTEGLEGVDQRSAGLEARAKKIESDKSAEERASQIEASVDKMRLALDQSIFGLSARVDKVCDDMTEAEKTLLTHQEEFNTAAESRKDMGASLEQVKTASADNAASIGNLNDRASTLEGLERELQSGIEELRRTLERLAEKEELMKVGQDVQRIDRGIRELKSKDQGDLRGLFDALASKEASDVQRITKELNVLQSRLGSFLDKGASATARCLSCFDRRVQLHNTIVVGSDGKTYLKNLDGVSVGRLNHTSGSSRATSPTRPQTVNSSPSSPSKVASPIMVRGGMGALSTGSLGGL
eukprot:TRINITY_DN63546_c0_g1_i1.p1 TRINITY_DN63546_c0_g1~~TRINITY_DN63546_c0_g1_i1.p1  ORF type:complete len:423 (+),score=91.46 TRINITY_DN63546_c0_g1_i1:317-1585(+)